MGQLANIRSMLFTLYIYLSCFSFNLLSNNIAVGTKLSCHTYQPIIRQIVVDGSWHPRDRTTTPSWPYHDALVTVPQHPHDRTTTPSWLHHKGLLNPSPARLLVARKARNFPPRKAFRLEDSSLLPPFSAMRPAIWPQNSFLRGSVCWNSEPLTSAQSIGKSVEKGVKHVFWGLQEAG